MKTLWAPRATKGIDQVAMSGEYRTSYMPVGSYPTYPGFMSATPSTGLSVITAYQCVRILANTFATIPTILYERMGDGGRKRADSHRLYKTFATQANPDMSAFDWKQNAKSDVETWGNHYSEIIDTGVDVELWPFRPDRIEPYWKNGRKAFDYLHPTKGRQELKPERVFHLKALTTDGLRGIPPVEAMRRAIGLYTRAERYGESVFDNGARPAGVLLHPKTLSSDITQRLGAQMDAMRGAGNAGKTVVLEEGMEFKEIGFPPEDAQFMETRTFQKREIAGGFGVPMAMIGEEVEAEEYETSSKLLKWTMSSAFQAFEQAAQMQVIHDDRYYVEFLDDAFLRADPKARADAYAVAWEHGALSGDEWRKRENQDPLPDGQGEIYYRPANWVPLADDLAKPEPVGGDASVPSQFGQPPAPIGFGQPAELVPAALVDQVTRAKSAVHCPACDKLLIPDTMDVRGGSMTCHRCKAEVTVSAA